MKTLLDVLLPPSCPGCGREGVVVCPACERFLERRMDEPAGVPFGLRSPQPPGIVQLEWCANYGGPARACVHALKYGGELRLVEALARVMADRWRRVTIGGEILVPVPVHAARRRQRGFDQAELLARQTGRLLDLPVVNALERAAATAAQHGLGRQERASNVRRVFAIDGTQRASVAGKWIVLVDDVVTTGATLAGCSAELYRAGARAVSALTLARER